MFRAAHFAQQTLLSCSHTRKVDFIRFAPLEQFINICDLALILDGL